MLDAGNDPGPPAWIAAITPPEKTRWESLRPVVLVGVVVLVVGIALVWAVKRKRGVARV